MVKQASQCGCGKNHHISQVNGNSFSNFSKGYSITVSLTSWGDIHIEDFHTFIIIIIIL